MHDGHEGFCNGLDLLARVNKVFEESVECLEVLEVFVGFSAGCLDLFLEFGESRGVSALVLLEELENLLNALRIELLANRVQVVTLVAPEVELLHEGNPTAMN